MEIVIASLNVHKIRELRDMFVALKHVDLMTLHQFPQYSQADEIYSTFSENALVKAREASRILKKWAIADDSGLIVPKLEGAPGVHSKRYAGEDATDAENRKKLLKEMEGMVDLERAAYYECCLALVSPEGLEIVVTGICEGEILKAEKGRHGFGYDSIFQKHDYDKSFAEIEEGVKNRISHRRKAFDKLATALEKLQSSNASS